MRRLTKRVRRVERDPRGGWIARDKFGVEYIEPGFRWNSRSVARCVVDEDKMFGDRGVEAHRTEIEAKRQARRAALQHQDPDHD